MVTLSVVQYGMPSRPATNRYDMPGETGYDEHRMLELACIHVEEVTRQETLICSHSRSSRRCALSLFASIASSPTISIFET